MNCTRNIRVFAICCLSVLIPAFALAQHNTTDPFAAYTACGLPGGPKIVEVTPVAAGVTGRTVPIIGGSATVPITKGRRIMFAYPGEDFYANMKVELLPADGYAESKAALVDNFDYVLASDNNVRNYKFKPKLNGFNIQGLDRTKREGGTLGMYLLFDDPTHTVITIYFLNQEPPKDFQTMQQYATLRDRFLQGYTACVRRGLAAAPAIGAH
jgi:hypothetical protein